MTEWGRLHRLTEKILDVTKIESQLLKSDKEHFNLNDIISNAVLDLQNQIEENKDSFYIMMLSLLGQISQKILS